MDENNKGYMDQSNETKNADENIRNYMSEPDEDGVRYFDMGNSGIAYGKKKSGKWGKKGNMWRNLCIFLVIVLVICAGAYGFSSFTGVGKNLIGGTDVGNNMYVATLYVEGTIQEGNVDYFGNPMGYQHDWTIQTIDELIYDYNNLGLIIFVDSPGGTIYESDALYLKIREYQELTERPVYAVMGSMAASGGYYISAPCDAIYANRNTWTGSIGVTIGTILDFSEFLDNYGIKAKTITSGTHKAMGSSFQEMTEEEEAIWQALVDEAYYQFIDVVADGRNMETDTVKKLADGRILSAYQAMEAGLVDSIGGVDEAYSDMIAEEDIWHYAERRDIIYPRSSSPFSWLLGMLGAVPQENETDSVIDIANSVNSYPASYICEMLDY